MFYCQGFIQDEEDELYVVQPTRRGPPGGWGPADPGPPHSLDIRNINNS